VGAPDAQDDHLFHILYDGTLIDEDGTCVLGGEADAIGARLESAWVRGAELRSALGAAVGALEGPERTLGAADLEVAVLDRSNGRRTFRRIEDDQVSALLAD
jgi:proteasome alpha subunit